MGTVVSFVIPVFNAGSTIGPLVRALVEQFAGTYALDVVLVDDASSDDSEQACLRLQAEHPELITYLRLARNFGEHNAVMAGLHHARGEYVVTMDDDLQHAPQEVTKLLAEMANGHDIVYASYETRRDPWLRRAASALHGRLARVFLRKPVTLTLSTFRVMNAFLCKEIIKYSGPMPYIDAIVLRLTSNIGSVPVEHRARRSGRSTYTIAKLVSVWGNSLVSYSLIPLRIIGLLGVLFVVLGSLHGGFILLDIGAPDRAEPSGYERLSAVITFFRGLQLVAISIVGEYVGRTFLHLNRDPQFVVRRTLPATGSERRRAGPPAAP
ncbi:MAG TPA: glycosyltransferase family 2 protein [bacterium]